MWQASPANVRWPPETGSASVVVLDAARGLALQAQQLAADVDTFLIDVRAA